MSCYLQVIKILFLFFFLDQLPPFANVKEQCSASHFRWKIENTCPDLAATENYSHFRFWPRVCKLLGRLRVVATAT